jgi:uncharacterized membrane protein
MTADTGNTDEGAITLSFRPSGPNVAQWTAGSPLFQRILRGKTMSVPIIVGLLLLIIVVVVGTSINRKAAQSSSGTQSTVIMVVVVVIVAIVAYFILAKRI